MKKTSSWLCVAAALTAVAGCNNTPAGNDAGMMSMNDTGMGGGTDTGPQADTGVRTDTGMTSSGGTCAVPIDIDADGTPLAMGTGRRITGSNASAPAGVMAGLLNAECATGSDGSNATNEVVFSYTMQSNAYLSVTTADSATTMGMDTIVWVLDGCSATAAELACNDDAGGELTSRALSSAMIPMGTEVFIVVAGYDGADVATGTFGLVVSELAPHAAGEACDADNFYCVAGHTCIVDEGSTDTGHCLADGADRGLCRTTAPFCDSGLGCTNPMPTADDTGQCQMPIATGAACTTSHYLCESPMASCQLDEGSDTMGHCLADGAEFGRCRTTGTACDGALVCSNAMPTADDTGTCQMPIAGGGLCTQRHSVCVDGFSCQADDMSETMAHCVADGADLGECRLTMPYCDGALVCSVDMPTADDNGNCLTPIASGEVCSAWRYLCVDGSSCIADEGSTTMGHCLLDGTAGAACRATAPECDSGLECDFFGLCNPPAG